MTFLKLFLISMFKNSNLADSFTNLALLDSHETVMRQAITLLQLKTIADLFVPVCSHPTFQKSPYQTRGLMTMALPFRQKARVKSVLGQHHQPALYICPNIHINIDKQRTI